MRMWKDRHDWHWRAVPATTWTVEADTPEERGCWEAYSSGFQSQEDAEEFILSIRHGMEELTDDDMD